MTNCLERLNDWMDPQKKFKFISENNFADFLGIKQTAVMDLVQSKRIDSVVVDGRTWIPLSLHHSQIWVHESNQDDREPLKVNWSAYEDNTKK